VDTEQANRIAIVEDFIDWVVGKNVYFLDFFSGAGNRFAREYSDCGIQKRRFFSGLTTIQTQLYQPPFIPPGPTGYAPTI
jgi:hypothetical protein